MKVYFYLTFVFIAFYTNAQTSEEYLVFAKNKAGSELYEQALQILKTADKEFPYDHDLMAYQARVKSWQGNLLEADSLTNMLLFHYPMDLEALLLKAKIKYWAEDNNGLLDVALQAHSVYPQELDFLYYAALAYLNQGKYRESKKHTAQILSQNPNHIKAVEMNALIKEKFHDYVSTGFSYTRFNKILDPWTQATVGFGSQRKLKWNVGLTCVQRFGDKGFNINSEIYPRLGKNNYLLVEASYSNKYVFPRFSLGAEVFQTVKRFEFSIGGRFMSFNEDDIWLYRAGLGFYLENYFFQYKAYSVNSISHFAFTHSIKIRKYFKSINQYLELQLTKGDNPIDFRALSEVQVHQTKSIRIEFNQVLSKRTFYKLYFGYRIEEYFDSLLRNRIEIGVGVKKIL